MADMTPSRLGMINGTGADDALFLRQFSGEVLTAFEEVNVMQNRHLVRTIKNGESAQFPATWKATAYYHTPGVQITGNQIKHGQRTITVDDLLISPVFIAKIDEAKNHYDVRSIYSKEAGAALAIQMDKNVLQVGVNAARASATISGAYGGSTINSATFATSGEEMVAQVFKAAEIMDGKDVSETGRFVVLRPAQYYLLVQNDKVINKDFTAGNGDIKTGKVYGLAGLEVVKSNHIPSTSIATGPTEYQGNFTTTNALVMHPNAVGTVKLLDLAVEGEYKIEYQGTLIVAKYAVGHGILRPEAAVEIRSANPV